MQAGGEGGAALGALRGALRTPRPLPPSAYLRFSAAPRMSGAEGAHFSRVAIRRKSNAAPGAGGAAPAGAPARSTAAGNSAAGTAGKHRSVRGSGSGWLPWASCQQQGAVHLPKPGQVRVPTSAVRGLRLEWPRGRCSQGSARGLMRRKPPGPSELIPSARNVIKLCFLFTSMFVTLLHIRTL